MKLSQAQEEKLLDYLDGAMSTAEKELFEQEIKKSLSLQVRLEEFNNLDSGLRAVKIEQPSKIFTEQVMGKLDQYPIRSSSLLSRNGIFLLIGVLLAVVMSSLLLAGGVFDGTSSIDLNQTIFPNKYFQENLPTIYFNGKMVVNIIILLNLALAFLVLDRAILKPWFERRTRMYF